MEMCFFTGHKFVEKNGNIYTTGSLNNTVLGRYVKIFENVTVCAKIITNKKPVEENIVNCVEFDLFDKKSSLKKQLRKIEKIVISTDCSVVRVPSLIGFMAVKYAKKHKKPYLLELVGCPWDAFWNHGWAGKLLAPAMWFLTKDAVKNAPYVTYVTENFLQKRYPTKGKSLACSDVELKDLNQNIIEKRIEKIKNKERNVVLGTIGVVNLRYKGQEHVIRAAAKLIKEGYNIKYKLVGGGDNSYLKQIAKKYHIENDVVFCGSIPHDKVFEFLDEIDIYIQPSLTEGLPRALIEAMSRACTVMGSDVGGIPELVDEKYIFKKKDTNALYDKIKCMIRDNELLLQAQRSFEKANDFAKCKLDEKRTAFYAQLKEDE